MLHIAGVLLVLKKLGLLILLRKAGQIYRLTAADGRYTIGHSVSLGAVLIAAIGYATLYVVLRRANRSRDGMSVEERVRAMDAGMDGDRHPDFRYVL